MSIHAEDQLEFVEIGDAQLASAHVTDVYTMGVGDRNGAPVGRIARMARHWSRRNRRRS
ncbi:hypothetical protein EKH55_3151 [Sinorhizobium alkalisoli]|nr:hypothetical protein EKH55_3151 [Sinorhizobium alkalisoli]